MMQARKVLREAFAAITMQTGEKMPRTKRVFAIEAVGTNFVLTIQGEKDSASDFNLEPGVPVAVGSPSEIAAWVKNACKVMLAERGVS